MLFRYLTAALVVCGIAVPMSTSTLAQSASECSAMFRAADDDGDGVLTGDEIANLQEMPDALEDRDEVTLQEFLAECGD